MVLSWVCRVRLLLALAVVFGLSGVSGVALGSAGLSGVGGDRVQRLAGADRYQTAVEVAMLVGGGSLAGLDRLIMVSGESFPDGLAASGLAGFLDDGGRSSRTAILLTQSGMLPPVVADAIRASGVPADRILIVGGVAAVSDAVRSQIAATAGWDGTGVVPVTRIAGQDRYETAAAIVNFVIEAAGDELPASYSTVLVASGEQFPDALAAGSLAYRNGHLLVLSPQPGAPTVTLDAIQNLTANCVLLIGGTAALAPPVATQLDTVVTGTGCGVERIAGQNRYGTAAQVANRFIAVNGAPREPLLASGVEFADALTAGPLAAGNRPLLLTTPDQLPAATSSWLRQQRASINEVLIIGGTNTISPAVATQVNQDLNPSRPTPPPPTPGPAGLNLSYASTSFSTNQTSQTRAPTVTGASGTLSFASTGTLPAGVTFDTTTGVFTGPAAWNFTALQIAAGNSHTCAVLDDGEARCWGSNSRGQLGDGTTANSSVPVTVTTGAGTPLMGITQIAAGLLHSCAVLDDGEARCWGWNFFGQLGDGTSIDRSIPVAVLESGTVAGGNAVALTDIASVSAGGGYTCALLDDGEARCWGLNESGQLGDGTTTDSSVPVTVTTAAGTPLSVIAQVAAGGAHTCALLDDGEARCWGWNFFGQLGDGTTTASSVPVTVTTAAGTPLAEITQIATSPNHTCAVLTDRTGRCWGLNGFGALGDGSIDNSSVPVTVTTAAGTPLAEITQVTAGSEHSCAVLDDMTVRCWGGGGSGQLGNASNIDSTVPVAVTTGAGIPLSGVAQFSAGMAHTCAVLGDGTARCWGLNDDGQLGDGSSINSSVPVTVLGLGNVGWPAAITAAVTDSTGRTTSVNITLTYVCGFARSADIVGYVC